MSQLLLRVVLIAPTHGKTTTYQAVLTLMTDRAFPVATETVCLNTSPQYLMVFPFHLKVKTDLFHNLVSHPLATKQCLHSDAHVTLNTLIVSVTYLLVTLWPVSYYSFPIPLMVEG